MEKKIHIDAYLVDQALQGNEKAKAELYLLYSRSMYNICIRMTGNAADAEDLLHEIFILAFGSLHQLKNKERFGGWLKKITLNECIRFSKKRIRWTNVILTENYEDDNSPWYLEFDLSEIHNAIKSLPDGCRQIFTLYAVEDKTHKEIADCLSISESTSKSQYHRAKFLLKQFLNDKKKNNGPV